jgi:hypothetical protein
MLSGTDRWRHRRRLVYSAVGLGILMIGSAILDLSDRAVSSELVRGGVALISLVLSGYVFAATFDDKWSGNEPVDEYPADSGSDGGRGDYGDGGWPAA